VSERPTVFKALSMLENEYIPLLKRRAPYWRPRPAPCFRDCYTPDWNWTHPAYSPELGMDLSVLDRNGAYVSAASSANFAHGELEHTGALSTFAKAPGYYKIDWHTWQDDRIPSPLGSAQLSGKVWVSHPTVEQLVQLQNTEEGYWPEVRIHDSWTCPTTVRFRDWATAVNNVRAEALGDVYADPDHDPSYDPGKCPDCRACPWYTAVKNGYAMAVQMFLGQSADGSVKSGVKRPDWYHTIHAQHAATTWRYVWKGVLAGFEPVSMGGTDEVIYPSATIPELETGGHLKIDRTGVALGTFKIKEEIPAAAAA
jgi:hypothetical protein